MKLEKAIEILTHYCGNDTECYYPDLHDAVKLGTEALKRILKERQLEDDPDWGHLSSETRD